MARKALIVFVLILVAAFCFVASAQDPQANKHGGGGGGPPYGHGGYYPPGHHGGHDPWHPGHHGGHYPGHPGHHGGYPPHCRWGCCHRSHFGKCLRCC